MEQVKAMLIDWLSNSDDRARDRRWLQRVLTVKIGILVARYVNHIEV